MSKSLSISSQDKCSSSSHLGVPCWPCSSLSLSFPYWGGGAGPKLDTVFRCGSNQAKGDNYVPQSPGLVPTDISRDVAGCWLSCKTTTLPVYLEHQVSVTRLVMKLSMWIFKMWGCCRLSGMSMHFELTQPQEAAVVLKWVELWRLFIRDERKAVA